MILLLCELFLYGLCFFTGASVYSFLNVVICRIPRGMSFVKGKSICPSCGHPLRAADMIPIFSYLFLRGRCRYCRAAIGARDTLVELMGGLTLLFCFYKFEDTKAALTVFLFYSVLTVVAFLDNDTMKIPDGCHIAILAASVLSWFTMPGNGILSRLAGAVCVSFPMLFLALLIPGAFGGGDIKLMAACGLFLGWKLTLVSMILALFLGGIWAIGLLTARKVERKGKFAFGPFLCLGMGIGLVWGQQLADCFKML